MRAFRRPPKPSLAPVWRYVAALRAHYYQHATARTKASSSSAWHRSYQRADHHGKTRNTSCTSPSRSSSAAQRLSSPSPLEDAASLSEFELLAPLGRGTFGVVRLARHVATERRVAIKALELSLVAELRQEESIAREKEVHATLRHPFICSLLGAFEDARALFLVLEYCPGGELFGLLYDQEDDQEYDRDGVPTAPVNADDSDVDTDDVDELLTPTDASGMDYEALCRRHQQLYQRLYPGVSASLANVLAKRALHGSKLLCGEVLEFDSHSSGGIVEWGAAFYLACVASALRYLHANGVLYRDLKLENLMLDSAGYVKLIDFGQCKLSSPSSSQKASTMCGSREYMAPEVLQRHASDARADLWAFGVVMYELLIGHTPFYHDSPRELARKIIHDDVEFPDGFHAAHPRATELIRWLLMKNPAQRPASFDEVMRESPFFRAFFPTDKSWEKLEKKKLPAPFVPSLDGEFDTRMFRSGSGASDAGVWGGYGDEEDGEDAAAAAAY